MARAGPTAEDIVNMRPGATGGRLDWHEEHP
ncbi:hypothetical protein F01_360020 [Burkholderia cenocepacia]|nr:hypothetical protein F01_360020 [Burkholderia cenocepacia]